MSAPLCIVANRDGQLRTVSADERDQLTATGEWIAIVSEPPELTNYKRPRRLHRSPRVAEYVRDRQFAEYANQQGIDGEQWLRDEATAIARARSTEQDARDLLARFSQGDDALDDAIDYLQVHWPAGFSRLQQMAARLMEIARRRGQ